MTISRYRFRAPALLLAAAAIGLSGTSYGAEPPAVEAPYLSLSGTEAEPLYQHLATNTFERFSLKPVYLDVMIRTAAVKMDQHPALASYRFPATLGAAPGLDTQGILGSPRRIRSRSGKTYGLTLRNTSSEPTHCNRGAIRQPPHHQ